MGVETDRRGFVPVNDKMQVLDPKGKPVPHLYCIGDANGKAHSVNSHLHAFGFFSWLNCLPLHAYLTCHGAPVLTDQACDVLRVHCKQERSH